MPVDPSQPEHADNHVGNDMAVDDAGASGRLAPFRNATGRLVVWAASHRLVASILISLAAMAMVGIVAGWLWWTLSRVDYANATLAMALDALDAGNLVEARAIAKVLIKKTPATVEEAGGPAYILGAVAYADAMASSPRRSKTFYLLAARYLDEAYDRGFLPDRKPEGLLLLGKALYYSDQIPASRPMLREALREADDDKTKAEIHWMLAEANLNDTVAQLDEAMADNQRYLASDQLTQADRDRGLLQRACILFRMDRIDECVETLESMSTAGRRRADTIVLRGRMLMREARLLTRDPTAGADAQREAAQRYETAIRILRQAQGVDTVANEATRRAAYLIGVCFLELDNPRAAAEQFDRLRKIYPHTPEALAADLKDADVHRRHGRNEEALACYQRLLGAIGDPTMLSNPWFTADELRESVLTAYEEYGRTGNYACVLQLTGMLGPLFSSERATEMRAQTLCEWGQTLLAQAEHAPPAIAQRQRHEGRLRLRQAGQSFGRLAKARIATVHYPDDLWSSAESYLAGQDYQNAARVFRRYLDNESRRRNPSALVSLGESLLALGQYDEALEPLNQCIEFHPSNVAAFRARLLAAQVYREANQPEDAERLLRDTLAAPGITPESTLWRDSLLALGKLLHATGRFDEAIARLEESVQREPDTPGAIEAQYLIADAYRCRAAATREKMRGDVVQSARAAYRDEFRELLTAARDRYDAIQQRLVTRQDVAGLTLPQRAMLRNCRYAIAAAWFDLGEYERAIREYETIVERYPAEPAVLQAYLQMIRALEHLKQPDFARRAARQAQAALARVGEHADFTRTTNQSREQWEALFDQLAGS